MQLFPRPPFFLQNAYASLIVLETEGDERVSILRADSLHPVEIGQALHFAIYTHSLAAPLEVYHGDKLIHTQTGGAGPLTFDYTATSTANSFEFRSEGEGILVEMTWPSIIEA